MTGGTRTTNGATPLQGKALPGDARPRNRALLLQALHRDGPHSRADLARASGLTPTTVSAVAAELLADGLIGEVGLRRSPSAGKPATLLAVEPDGRHTVALDLSHDDVLRAAVVDLAGRVVGRLERPRRAETGSAATAAVVRLALDAVATVDRPLLGIGCATPGVVDDRGVVRTAAHVRWTDEPLAGALADATGVPSHVTNDANAAVLAEHAAGHHRHADLLVVRIAGGLGAGLVLGGELVTGARFAAGEIGHVVVDEGGPVCACGRRGCLEAVVAPALVAAPGDDHAARLAVAGRHLGAALAPLVGALDLGDVVVSGPGAAVDDRFRAAVEGTIRERTLPAVGGHVTVRASSLGDDGVLLGAASLVLRQELGVA